MFHELSSMKRDWSTIYELKHSSFVTICCNSNFLVAMTVDRDPYCRTEIRIFDIQTVGADYDTPLARFEVLVHLIQLI
jgi:hypothetical protein